MKKIIAFLVLFIALIALGFTAVKAEGEETFIYEEDNHQIILTIIDETTFTLSAIEDGEVLMEAKGNYTVGEKTDTLDLNLAGEYFATVELNWETHTYDILDDYEPVYEYPCKIVPAYYDYGDLELSNYAGEIGDIITIYPKPMVFCSLEYIKVNGIDLIPNADGVYSFALIEGDNNIEAKFKIDEEKMAVLVNNINNAEKGNWEDIFSWANFTEIITWAIMLISTFSACIVALKNKKIKAMTTEEVTALTEKAINTSLGKYIMEYLDNSLLPLIADTQERSVSSEEIVKTMARCMVLMQENSDSSRLAIIKELTNLTTSDKDLSKEVQEVIQKKIDEANKKIEDTQRTIEELKEKNNALLPKEEPVVAEIEEENIEGRI